MIASRRALLALLPLALLSGCRPFEAPKYNEVAPNETAFVIPLEGDSSGQAKLASEDFLNAHKVAAKRIQLPLRWNSTGRLPSDGAYIDMVRVVKVDRSPVTRQWTADDKVGKDRAIWVESADSIGCSTGFAVTAYIEEGDTARFLYSYVSTSLAQVMDSEMRARIQMTAANISAKYKMDALRERKSEIIEAIKTDVVPFFKAKGITVTTIGMFGGFTYENPKIQDSIDATFIAQQEKVVASAILDAQSDKNKQIEMAATAAAEAARKKGQGEADAKFASFQAEANGLREVNKALAEANQNPLLIELKKIEVEKVRADRWNGAYPQWMMNGAAPGLMLNVAPPALK